MRQTTKQKVATPDVTLPFNQWMQYISSQLKATK